MCGSPIQRLDEVDRGDAERAAVLDDHRGGLVAKQPHRVVGGIVDGELRKRRLEHLGDGLAEDPRMLGRRPQRPRSLTVPMNARSSSEETTGTCETPCSRISSSARPTWSWLPTVRIGAPSALARCSSPTVRRPPGAR